MATIGVVWCSVFTGPWLSRSWRLPCAYRAPSLFASKMRQHGHDVTVFSCDEKLELSSLDGTQARLHDDVEILYVSTHGEFGPGGYSTELNKARWFPNKNGLAGEKLKIAVFDTCELLDKTQDWRALWQINLGQSLRVILGFEGSVADGHGPAERGGAFADELIDNKRSFADAWLIAAFNKIGFGAEYKRAIAVGVGDNPQDASSVLTTASLKNMPPARGSNAPSLHLKA